MDNTINELIDYCDNNRCHIEYLFKRLLERSSEARSMYYKLDFTPKYNKHNMYDWIGIELSEVQKILDELKHKFS